jgi:large subunit ribosomal protein L2
MSIRLYKSYTPGTRNRALSSFSEIQKLNQKKTYYGKIIVIKVEIIEVLLPIRHRGGGHKRLYRLIDFKRNKYGIEGSCCSH